MDLERIFNNIDALHEKLDAMRNDMSADRLAITERVVELEGRHNSLAGKIKIYVSLVTGAIALAAAWAKTKFM